MPFSACENDFDSVKALQIKQNIFDPHDGKVHGVYTGTLLDTMRPALELLFSSLQQLRKQNPEKWDRFRLHFIGTQYSVLELAGQYKIADLVDEHSQRVPFLSALKTMLDSHLIFMIGSNDAGYSPSKIYACLMAEKAIIALAYRDSFFSKMLGHLEVRGAVDFSGEEDKDALKKIENILEGIRFKADEGQFFCDQGKLSQYKTDAMTKRLAAIFDAVIKR